MCPLRNLVPLAIAAVLPAQAPAAPPLGSPSVAQPPMGVDHNIPAEPGIGSGGLPAVAASGATPADIVDQYWYWNRTAYLPRPAARNRTPPARDAAQVTSASPRTGFDRGWLLAATTVVDTAERALAVTALGAGGAPVDGFARLVERLGDPAAEVRQAAILGLGEFGGTSARFELARVAQDGGRPGDERALAVVAYELAAYADGGVGVAAVPGMVTAGDAAAAATCREYAFAGASLVPSPGLAELAARCADAGAAAAAPLAILHAMATGPAGGIAPRLVKLRAADGQLPLAALIGAVEQGALPADQLRAWLDRPSPADEARVALALAEHPAFHAIGDVVFAKASLRAVTAVALAVHGQRFPRAGIVQDLAVAERRYGAILDRPLWLLAQALAGDPSAPVRARRILADGREPVRLVASAVDVLAMDGRDLDALRYLVLAPVPAAVRILAADGLARQAGDADVALFERALLRAGDPDERGALLEALGRTRLAGAIVPLRQAVGDTAAPPVVRRGALRGLAHWLRWSGEFGLARICRGVRYALLPRPLLAAIAAHR